MAQRIAVLDITGNLNKEYPQLKDSFSTNKQLLAEFEKQILYALSYFTELKNSSIHFKIKKGKAGIISTRPSFGSIFKKSKNRTYIVLIHENSFDDRSRSIFRDASVNGQVGILGHELTHILNFNRMSSWGLLQVGLGHISKSYVDRFENKTDSVCIERGLGYQLIDWKLYLQNEFGMKEPDNKPDPDSKQGKQERYMSPSSIRRVMSKSALYQ